MYTEEQSRLLVAIKKFLSQRMKQTFIISGLAGCGKTYLLSKLEEELDLRGVVYIVYTGKAANVLQNKGVPARTIHSLMYELVDSDRMIFVKRKTLPSSIKLIVVDEISMINSNIWDDLLSYKVPIIATGDPNQLPPIGHNPHILDNPDFVMTDIVRQAQDSRITKLARWFLDGHNVPYGKWGDLGNSIEIIPKKSFDENRYNSYSQVLCSLNRSRIRINQICRTGREDLLESGDKLLITKNYWNCFYNMQPIINGSIFKVTRVDLHHQSPIVTVHSEYQDKLESYSLYYKQVYNQSEAPKDYREYMGLLWSYGYAITVHKAQGSEYDNVCFVLTNGGFDRETSKKLIYTAITRAKKDLTIVVDE